MSTCGQRVGVVARQGSVGSSLVQVWTAGSDEVGWRCLEISAPSPVRCRLSWHADLPDVEPYVEFDVTRTARVYVSSNRLTLSARRIVGSDNITVTTLLSDVEGPVRQDLEYHEVLAAGTYDSVSSALVRPPPYAARVAVLAPSTTTGQLALYVGSDQVCDLDLADVPQSGVSLAGITRVVVNPTGGPMRLIWILQM